MNEAISVFQIELCRLTNTRDDIRSTIMFLNGMMNAGLINFVKCNGKEAFEYALWYYKISRKADQIEKLSIKVIKNR